MLHILWILLKIILIILGILLGLALLAVLLLLFCPVRYRAHGEKNGSGLKALQGEAHVSWLFRALGVHISWQDGEKNFVITVFGVPLDKLRSFLKKSGSRKKKPAGAKATAKKNQKKKLAASEKKAVSEKPEVLEKRTAVPEKPEAPEKPVAPEQKILPEKLSVTEETPIIEKISITEKLSDVKEVSDTEKKTVTEEEASGIENIATSEEKASAAETPETFAESPSSEIKEERVTSSGREFWSRIKGIIKKIIHLPKTIWQKITSIIKGVKEKLKKIRQTIKKISGKIGWWRSFLGDERTKAALSLVWKDTKGLVHHALPTRIWGEVVFGCEDPAITGTALAVLGMTFPFHKNKVKVTPLFEGENQLTGNVSLKGRIYGVVLVKAVLEIYLNKNIKYVIRQWKHKED